MTFYGKYGHLSVVDAAKQSLLDISRDVSQEYFNRIDDLSLSSIEKYDLIRLHRMVEGLQQVIWLNNGIEPATWLPKLFDHTKYKRYSGK